MAESEEAAPPAEDAAAEDEKVEPPTASSVSESSGSDEMSEATKDLISAITAKNIDDLRSAILSGADINVETRMTATSKITQRPLHYAISKKWTKGALALIKVKKCDVNAPMKVSRRTPLHLASFYALDKVVAALLKRGASAVIKDKKGMLPINIIGEKYPGDDFSPKMIEAKSEIQLLLLEASTEVVEATKASYDATVAHITEGFSGLKTEANTTIDAVQEDQGMKFDVMWPFKYADLNRYRVWIRANKSVSAFLERRMLKVEVPCIEDEELERAHFNFSLVKDFQIALAKELLSGGGLELLPERPPKAWAKKAPSSVKKKKGTSASSSSASSPAKSKKKKKKTTTAAS